MPDIQRVKRLAIASIFVALAVMAIKFVAWRMTGSVALFSDALESIVNIIASIIAYSAVRFSHKPPDLHHPYGHHKVEYFSAVIEGVMIVVAALMIFYAAARALFESPITDLPVAGMVVNGAAAVLNAGWAFVLIRAGRRERSLALEADGRHLLADLVTSVGVLAGLVAVLATGYVVLDSLLAFVVGGHVLYQGWKIVRKSMSGLMDEAVNAKTAAKIERTILDNMAGAIEVHDIKTRMSGPATFIEFHMVVDGKMSVTGSHEICDRIENALGNNIPGAIVTIHVEPDNKQKGTGLRS